MPPVTTGNEPIAAGNEPIATGIEVKKPKKQVTRTKKAGKFVLRESVLAALFFPQREHKRHLAEQTLREMEAKGKEVSIVNETVDGVHFTEHSIRGKIVWFIHSSTVQTILLLFLVLDVMIVIAELIVAGHKQCYMHVDPHHSCTEIFNYESYLHEMGLDHHEAGGEHLTIGILNNTGYFPPYGCGVQVEQELPHTLHDTETALMWASRAILIIFAVELITLFCCLLHKFCTATYLLDTIVIGVSLALSFLLEGNDGEYSVGLLIFLRCWRFLRILHGFGLTVHEIDETKLEDENKVTKQEIEVVKAENEELKHALRKIIEFHCNELVAPECQTAVMEQLKKEHKKSKEKETLAKQQEFDTKPT